MNNLLVGIIEFLHVAAGLLWVGGAVFFDAIVAPLSKTAPLPHQKSIGDFIVPRAGRFFAVAGSLTILFGILRGVVGGRIDNVQAFGTSYGIVWLISLIASIAMAAWGARVIGPRAKRLYADESLWVPAADGSVNPGLTAAHKGLASAARIETVCFAAIIVGMVLLSEVL
jgi:uncharacterized membrane protein